MLTSSLDVGFYSYMWLWCLAIPDKRRRSLSPRFFICLNLGTWTDTQTIILITKLKTMKTKFFNYLLMGAFAIMSSVALISCGSDDDDTAPADVDNNDFPRDEYGVYTEGKKLNGFSESDNTHIAFYYTDNRLTDVVIDYYGNNNHYVWSEGKVEMKNDNGDVIRTYILDNGLVTKIFDGINEVKLSYNANRRLIKKEDRWDVTKYTWNSGRITKITVDEDVSIFKYKETCQQGHYPPNYYRYNKIWSMPYGDDYLQWVHPELFGLRINHLPSEVIYKEYDDGNELEFEDTIDYEYEQDEEGFVTTCWETINWEYRVVHSYFYSWE